MKRISIEDLEEFFNSKKIWEYCSDSSNKQWTNGVKNLLTDLKNKHFNDDNTFISSSMIDNCEWLFDFTIYKNNKNNFLEKLVLIAESEWEKSESALIYDFEKLLVANCHCKIFIFENYIEEDLQSKINSIFIPRYNFYNSANNLNVIDNDFYLIVWIPEINNFKIIKL